MASSSSWTAGQRRERSTRALSAGLFLCRDVLTIELGTVALAIARKSPAASTEQAFAKIRVHHFW
jgi:hypothetical protein